MINSINSFLVIAIIGALLLLTFLLTSNFLRFNRKANLFFGGYMFCWLSFWSDEIGQFIGVTGHVLWVDALITLLHFGISITFYYSVVYFTNPFKKLKWYDALNLALPVLLLLMFFGMKGSLPEKTWSVGTTITLLGMGLAYVARSFLLLRQHEQRIELFSSNRESVDLQWIKQIIYSLLLIVVFISVYNLFIPDGKLNFLANGLTLAVIYYIAIRALSQGEIYIVSEDEMKKVISGDDELARNKYEMIAAEDISEFKTRLLALMLTEKPYLERDLTLLKLAEKMVLTPHQLSYLINEGFGVNFFQYVNSYRVDEAKRLLNSDKHEHLSVLGIAYESGFNSKTAFNNVFKKIAGETPSSFKNRSTDI